jgi:ABC-type glycerol-3-phosphate transport system permease component
MQGSDTQPQEVTVQQANGSDQQAPPEGSREPTGPSKHVLNFAEASAFVTILVALIYLLGIIAIWIPIFRILQRYLFQGLTAGAVKG